MSLSISLSSLYILSRSILSLLCQWDVCFSLSLSSLSISLIARGICKWVVIFSISLHLSISLSSQPVGVCALSSASHLLWYLFCCQWMWSLYLYLISPSLVSSGSVERSIYLSLSLSVWDVLSMSLYILSISLSLSSLSLLSLYLSLSLSLSAKVGCVRSLSLSLSLSLLSVGCALSLSLSLSQKFNLVILSKSYVQLNHI